MIDKKQTHKDGGTLFTKRIIKQILFASSIIIAVGIATIYFTSRNHFASQHKTNIEQTLNSGKLKTDEKLVNVGQGNVGTEFNGNIRIGVIGISNEGEPIRNKISFAIAASSNSDESTSYVKKDVGFSTIVTSGRNRYKIQVKQVNASDATFSVIDLSSNGKQQ